MSNSTHWSAGSVWSPSSNPKSTHRYQQFGTAYGRSLLIGMPSTNRIREMADLAFSQVAATAEAFECTPVDSFYELLIDEGQKVSGSDTLIQLTILGEMGEQAYPEIRFWHRQSRPLAIRESGFRLLPWQLDSRSPSVKHTSNLTDLQVARRAFDSTQVHVWTNLDNRVSASSGGALLVLQDSAPLVVSRSAFCRVLLCDLAWWEQSVETLEFSDLSQYSCAELTPYGDVTIAEQASSDKHRWSAIQAQLQKILGK